MAGGAPYAGRWVAALVGLSICCPSLHPSCYSPFVESRQKKKSKHKHKRKKEKHKKEKHKKKRKRHSVASEDESRVRGATTAHQSTQHMALLAFYTVHAPDVLACLHCVTCAPFT